MKPWINSEDNPNQVNFKVEKVKLQDFFLPPRPKDDLFVVKLAPNEPKFEINSHVKKSKLLERSWIDIKHLEMSLNRINKVILPFRQRLAQNERRMFLYLLLGFAITIGLSLVFGFFVHYALSIVLICLYFGGLIYIVRKYQRENESLQRAIHFNTCLTVRNENERLYSRYNLRARVGFLS